jgi:hypothetical protein
VARNFETPALLLVDGRAVARIADLKAVVGDADAPFSLSVGPGIENLAWVIKDATGVASAWFSNDGNVYLSPE